MAELIRRVGISEQTFYRWKKQYSHLEVNQVRQLKPLQDENGRLEEAGGRTDAGPGHAAGRAAKKLVKPSRRRTVVVYLCGGYGVSERRACRVAAMPISSYRYRSRKAPQTELRMRMRELASARIGYGYRKIRVVLNREGWGGKKLVYRLYREEGLGVKKAVQEPAHSFGPQAAEAAG